MPRLIRLVAGLIMAALLLAGCGYRPLYGTSASGKSVGVALNGVSVDEQSTRAGQLVRNELISSMGASGGTYVLKLEPTEKTVLVSSPVDQKLKRYRYKLTMRYALLMVNGNKAATEGTSFSTISYDTVEQPVADLQAAENARTRATREVADDIRLRLAAFLSATQ